MTAHDPSTPASTRPAPDGARPVRSRRRRILVWLLLALVVVLAADRVRGLVASEPDVGHWDSPAGFAAYTEAYRAVMADLPEPTRTLDVPTGYGTVRVLEWAADDSPARPGALPVVLLPGRASGAPMWGENLPDWIGSRTLYALDPIGDAGLSSQSVPLADFDDQAEWIAQTLDDLGVERAHTIGHSFGGANAAIHALRHPGQVASLTLLEPIMVLHGLPVSTYFWATLTQLPVPQSLRDRALAEIGGTTVEEVRERTPMSVMIDAGSKHYSAAVPMPRTLSDDEWRAIDVPTRIDISVGQSLAGGADAVERAEALLPDALVTPWPGATHSLPMEERARLGPELEEFWTAHDGAR